MSDYESACQPSAFTLTQAVVVWLASSAHPRILHIFDRACNLINEHREVLSIVTPQIGNGPFNLVIPGPRKSAVMSPGFEVRLKTSEVSFNELNLRSQISCSPSQLILGNLIIHTADANLWNSRPNWERLHARKADIINQLTELPSTNYYLPITNYQSLLSNSLLASIAIADLPSSLTAARQLAGLGQGLTPSGDDFIMGAIYAAWIIHPPEIAGTLGTRVANTAASLTTSLSAAWLKSAGKGEAGILWHEFFNALTTSTNIQLPITQLLSIGETSGADALAGFMGVMSSFREHIIQSCHS